MKKPIYIFSDGELKRKQNTLYFEGEKGKKYVPVENTSEFLIFGEVTINKRLLEFLTEKGILVHFFNHYGYYVGSFYPREHNNSGMLILKQAQFYLDDEKRLELARSFVKGGVLNMLKVLLYYERRGVDLREFSGEIVKLYDLISESPGINELMAIEGNVREWYYKSFDKIVKSHDFSFTKRSRRPPENRLNALISFGNSMMYVTVLSEIYKTHLDPRIGFLHATNFRRFTLNLDVAEIFKPVIVDRVIFYLLNKGMIKASHFLDTVGGIFLNEKGRAVFVERYEEQLKSTIKHLKLKRNVSYRTLIRLELYKIEKHLLGDEEYKPFVTRW